MSPEPPPSPIARVRRIRRIDPEQLLSLYRQAGWLEATDRKDGQWIHELVTGSLCCFGAFQGKRLIGFGRAISDGVSDAYIQDVVVRDEQRGRGIGSRIVQALLRELRRRGIGWIGLIATPGSDGFYRRLGFRPLDGHVPMRCRRG